MSDVITDAPGLIEFYVIIGSVSENGRTLRCTDLKNSAITLNLLTDSADSVQLPDGSQGLVQGRCYRILGAHRELETSDSNVAHIVTVVAGEQFVPKLADMVDAPEFVIRQSTGLRPNRRAARTTEQVVLSEAEILDTLEGRYPGRASNKSDARTRFLRQRGVDSKSGLLLGEASKTKAEQPVAV
jgi:hypothetical protein